MKYLILVLVMSGISGCRSRSLLSDPAEVKASREGAAKNCREIGMITGTAPSARGTQEQALADLKKEAADKGANYVQVKEYSSYGTSVTGVAYECP